jgi:1,4-alpha-glucan branching enzyme
MSSNHQDAYSAHRNLQARNFVCNASQAQSVSLVGDFNKWDPKAHPMVRGTDGAWTTRVEFRHGHHRYAFWADGQLMLDPQAMGVARNDQGQRVSLMAVS